jgi:hypothetical protein
MDGRLNRIFNQKSMQLCPDVVLYYYLSYFFFALRNMYEQNIRKLRRTINYFDLRFAIDVRLNFVDNGSCRFAQLFKKYK